ncbi:hypothetical protein LTR37_011376 [Vermiconidia calcicola]|uniref:Uncharacterized protein n=1 Tax=Vermiconidia calcicola TaxID=1690605 RepID=A0ACC3N2H3_9PEZI|nr:hypothetical protein LTR37_011376 [Vermiconidia calcicola]
MPQKGDNHHCRCDTGSTDGGGFCGKCHEWCQNGHDDCYYFQGEGCSKCKADAERLAKAAKAAADKKKKDKEDEDKKKEDDSWGWKGGRNGRQRQVK